MTYENYREPGEFGEGATVRRAEPPSQHFLDLLDQYWNAAYQQGQEGRNHDDKEGSAQIAESALCAYVEGLRTQLIRMVEIAERRLIDLSAARASLYKIAAYDDAAANAYLRATGSYRCFDEPGAVEMARGVLEGRAVPPPPSPHVLPVELDGVSAALEYGKGIWRTCTGCHESDEGYPTGPYSAVMKCYLGGGCFECGGIGAVWDTTDYEDMGRYLAATEGEPDV